MPATRVKGTTIFHRKGRSHPHAKVLEEWLEGQYQAFAAVGLVRRLGGSLDRGCLTDLMQDGDLIIFGSDCLE